MNRTPLLLVASVLCAMIAALIVPESRATDYGSLGTSLPKGRTCTPQPAAPGYKWYGKAPFCNATKAKKDCKADSGSVQNVEDPVLPYCGDGSICETGYKILCKMPGAGEYQQGSAPASNDGTWTSVTTQSGVDTGEAVTDNKGQTSYIQYIGNPPFCNADNKVSECKGNGPLQVQRRRQVLHERQVPPMHDHPAARRLTRG